MIEIENAVMAMVSENRSFSSPHHFSNKRERERERWRRYIEWEKKKAMEEEDEGMKRRCGKDIRI